MIDSHCHLGIGALNDEQSAVEDVLQRAKQANVTDVLTVACDYEDVPDLKMMMSYPNVYGAFGIHPENAIKYNEERSRSVYAELPSLIALGEIGLDYYYGGDMKESQISAFEKQIELASLLHLPIIIHTREAEEDTKAILKSAYNGGLLRASRAISSLTPPISNITLPGFTTATQYSGAPLPEPILVSAGFLETGLCGKMLIQT